MTPTPQDKEQELDKLLDQRADLVKAFVDEVHYPEYAAIVSEEIKQLDALITALTTLSPERNGKERI